MSISPAILLLATNRQMKLLERALRVLSAPELRLLVGDLFYRLSPESRSMVIDDIRRIIGDGSVRVRKPRRRPA